jgi:hypothetical protein
MLGTFSSSKQFFSTLCLIFSLERREKKISFKKLLTLRKKTLIRPGLDTNPMLKNLSDVMKTSEK